jgi:uroporphyrinogen-III synthase
MHGDDQATSLTGWTVLVGRPPGRADELLRALRECGARVVHEPMIETEPDLGSLALQDALARLSTGEFRWLALTSAATVRALVAAAEQARATLSVAQGTGVAAVGRRTAAAAERAGLAVDLIADAPGSAAGLLEIWPDADEDAVVLLPRSSRAGPTLPDGLRRKGYQLETVTAYHTRVLPLSPQTTRRLESGEINAVLLTSSSTAEALAAGTPHPWSAQIVTIGWPTTATAIGLGLPVAAVAATPSTAGLIDALAALGHGNPTGHPVARPTAGSTAAPDATATAQPTAPITTIAS